MWSNFHSLLRLSEQDQKAEALKELLKDLYITDGAELNGSAEVSFFFYPLVDFIFIMIFEILKKYLLINNRHHPRHRHCVHPA